jgi:hypothetical protein
LIAAAGSAGAFQQDRTRAALISDPAGPHLQIYLDALQSDAIGEVAVADASGGIFERAGKTLPAGKLRTFRDVLEICALFVHNS